MKESYPKSAQPISDLEYVFFPAFGGTFRHFYVFGIDFLNKEKFCLNSMTCSEDFHTAPYYKQTGTRLMAYAKMVIQDMGGMDIGELSCKVSSAPEQPDLVSCGLYALRFMEHYQGRFTTDQKQQWAQPNVMRAD
ncbi:hypothetical protein LINGRAPRIM_LOCUS179, partial [Linum grandiflorum]